MSQSDWAIAASTTIDAELQLRVVVLRDGLGALAGIAPLAIKGRGLDARLVPIADRAYEPPAFVYRDEAALIALFESAGRLGLPLFLRGTYADSSEASVFARTPKGGFRPNARATPATAFKRLDIPDLDATVAGTARSKRKRKAAEKLGRLEVSFFSPDPIGAGAAFDDLVSVEARGWKGRDGTALAHDLPLQAFLRAYAVRCAARGAARFGRVSIGDTLAAMRLDVEWNAQRWEIKNGFDEQFAEVSPGQLLSYEAFRDGMERGTTVHNFLGGYEPWQDDWGIELRALANLRHFPVSPRGVLALAWEGAGVLAEKAGSKLFRA